MTVIRVRDTESELPIRVVTNEEAAKIVAEDYFLGAYKYGTMVPVPNEVGTRTKFLSRTINESGRFDVIELDAIERIVLEAS